MKMNPRSLSGIGPFPILYGIILSIGLVISLFILPVRYHPYLVAAFPVALVLPFSSVYSPVRNTLIGGAIGTVLGLEFARRFFPNATITPGIAGYVIGAFLAWSYVRWNHTITRLKE